MVHKILIIEDDVDILENLGSILEFNNFKTILAKDGEDGINKAIKENPDLILCDIMMPKIDGYGVLDEIRKTIYLSNTPFIFLTAKSNIGDKRDGMNKGADDYITKPFKVSDIVDAVNARLKRIYISKKDVETGIHIFEEKINKITSQEINSPLNAILGFSEIISNYYDDLSKPEIVEYSQLIYNAGKKLNNTFKKRILFTDLLHIQQKNYKLDVQNFKFNHIFVEGIIMKTVLEAQREDDLEIDIEEFEIQVSKEMFSAAVLELVENAVKFSKKGSLIKIYAYNFEKKHFIVIEDNGVGFNLPEDGEIKPFSKFSQDTISSEGSGLGLFISKTIIEKMLYAEFKIESKIGEYTRVTIVIP